MRRVLSRVLVAAVFLAASAVVPPVVVEAGEDDIGYAYVSHFAGGGIGDGGPATDAGLSYPADAAVDAAGNLYIADTINHRIRKVDPSGTITTVAGGGPAPSPECIDIDYLYPCTPSLGDGGPATAATLWYPSDVAIDASGNLYIADTRNHRVRKVGTSGIITTVAGDGVPGKEHARSVSLRPCTGHFFGLCIDVLALLFPRGQRVGGQLPQETGSFARIWAGCTGAYDTPAYCGAGVEKIGDGGPGVAASLYHPSGVAVDAAGNLFIAEAGGNRIRRVDLFGTITTIAGNGISGFSGDGGPATAAKLSGPSRVAIDTLGNVYIADSGNHGIRKISPMGTITTIAGNGRRGFSGDGGAATSASLNDPAGLAVDAAGNVFIADRYNHRVRKVDATATISTVAGNGNSGFSGDEGAATAAILNYPTGVVVDPAGDVFIADRYNHRLRKVDLSGTITTVAGNGELGDGGPAKNARFSQPTGVATDSQGNVYIADHYKHRIRKVGPLGEITTIAGTGMPGFSGDEGPASSAQLAYPNDVAVDSTGNVFVSEVGRIRKIDSSGTITTLVTSPWPGDLSADSMGNVFIAEPGAHRVRRIETSGAITTVAGTGIAGYAGDGGPAINAKLAGPVGVAVDSAGNLLIADAGNDRIRKVDGAGTITTIAGAERHPNHCSGLPLLPPSDGPAMSVLLDYPSSLSVDAGGNLYISEGCGGRILRLDVSSGMVTTIVGTGTRAGPRGSRQESLFSRLQGPYLSEGPGRVIRLTWPGDIAVDSAGRLFIADTGADRILSAVWHYESVSTLGGLSLT